MTDTELLRAVIITLAALNSAAAARLEDSPSCCGKRRYFAAAYTAGAGSVIFFLSVSATVAAREYISGAFFLGYTQIFILVLCTAAILFALRPLSRILGYERYQKLIFADSILLSVLLLMTDSTGLAKTTLRAAVFSAYFIPAMLLFSRLRTRVDESETLPCFTGVPVMLLSGAFLSLALTGIVGIVEKLFT